MKAINKEKGTMKKFFSMILVLMLAVSTLLVPMTASAASASGKTSKAVTFKVNATKAGASFVLSSSTGVAKVAQHNWLGRYTKDGNEKTHGFYKITIKGPNLNKSQIWAPSATTNKNGILTCREIKITMPSKGTYTVTIAPLSNSAAAKYWRVDWIKKWVNQASWYLTITTNCKVVK